MKEKSIRINTIEGYENVKDCYWISNSDEDKIMNKNTGRQLKPGFDKDGYKRVGLMTKDGKMKTCGVHVLKAKAFIFGPNPLDVDQVRHLNDVKTDNRLTNLAWGTRFDNAQDCIRNGNFNYEAAARGRTIGGKITGAKNGKRSSKPVKCLETGVIYPSTRDAGRKLGISNANISSCCRGKRHIAGGFHWAYVDKEVNNDDMECE